MPTALTTGSLSAGISYANLVALIGSVDQAYRLNGGFLVSPATHTYLLGQVDSTGRPLYPIDPNTGTLTIAGKPVYVNAAMAPLTTASKPAVLFGDYSKSYGYIHTGTSIKVLSERLADQMLSEAIIYTRIGATALVSGSVKAIVTASA